MVNEIIDLGRLYIYIYYITYRLYILYHIRRYKLIILRRSVVSVGREGDKVFCARVFDACFKCFYIKPQIGVDLRMFD